MLLVIIFYWQLGTGGISTFYIKTGTTYRPKFVLLYMANISIAPLQKTTQRVRDYMLPSSYNCILQTLCKQYLMVQYIKMESVFQGCVKRATHTAAPTSE